MTASQPPQPPEGASEPPAGAGPAHPPSPGAGAPGYPAQPGYGRPESGQPQYGQTYGQPPYGQPPYGQPHYGQPPYGQQAPPGQAYGHVPYGQPPYGPPGYAPPGYGPQGYAPPGYGPTPYGQQYGPAYGAPGYGAPYGPPRPQPAGGGAEFSFDLKRLTRSDYGVAGGTLLFLLLGLLPWWRFGDATFGVTFSGLDDGTVVSALVLLLLATGWALLPAFVRTTPTFPRSSVTAGLAGLGLVLTLFAWLDTLRYAFSLWALLALLTAAVITAVAGVTLRRELRSRPARRSAPPPPPGYWSGAAGPGQPYSYPGQQPHGSPAAPPWSPQPPPPPSSSAPGRPGPGQHGADAGWQRPDQAAGPGAGGPAEQWGATDSDQPRTDT